MRTSHYAIPCVLLAASLAACGTDPQTDDTFEPAPEGGQQLASENYHLAPGGEVYYCYQFYAPDEKVAITHIKSFQGEGVHHLGLYQAYGRDEEKAPHECNTLIKQTWMPVWGNNTMAQDMAMPDGTGFVIEPGTQYIMQLHLQNTGDAPLDIRVALNLTYEHDMTKIIPAGIFALGTMQFEIPPNTEDHTIQIDCAPNPLETDDMHIFAAEPHMHKLGTKLETIMHNESGEHPFYKIDPWIFGEQPIDKMDTVLHAGDHLTSTCHYNNHGSTPVKYGESSDNEMCFFVVYYYPFKSLGGCIVNF